MDTCKICGAARDPLAAQCKFCGTAYKLEKLTGEVYISALQNLLAKIDERSAAESDLVKFTYGSMPETQQKVTAIQAFAMPSDLECLLQFLAYCHGNAQGMSLNMLHRQITSAWFGKAKMAFALLKMKAIADPSLTPYIAEYESIYGNAPSGGLVGGIKTLLFGKK